MFTVDASVHLNALHPSEAGSQVSLACLEQLVAQRITILSPTLLLVEIAATTARSLGDAGIALQMASALRDLPGQLWIPLDDELAGKAARLGAEARLRGANAVYAAVAQRFGTTLVTRDRQQLERLADIVPVMTPEALVQALGN